MVHSIDSVLHAVEEKWLYVLYDYCRKIFSNMHIPSHDETHHYRVWQIAKELVHELGKQRFSFSVRDIERIIFTVFFHDTGMSVTRDPDHGKYSRQIAEEFMRAEFSDTPEGIEEILRVVEKHDDKEYKASLSENQLLPDALFPIVNVSDDLEAFGITGIYRYAEIYLIRGIPMNKLGKTVLKNLEKRYGFFNDIYGFLSDFKTGYDDQYEMIRSFYNQLIKQVENQGSNMNHLSGPSAVIHFIKDLIIERELPLNQVLQLVKNESADPFVSGYFRELVSQVTLSGID